MNHKARPVVFALASIALITGFYGGAQAQNECASGKIKASSRKAVCLAKLEAAEAASNLPPDPVKVQTCRDKLPAAFAKLESKGGCATSGDADAVESKVDDFVDLLAEALDETVPAEPNACEAAKIRAAAKNVNCKLQLKAKRAANPRFPPNPFRMGKCHDKILAAFDELDDKGGCNTIGDSDEVEELVDAFVDDINQLAPLLESACAPVEAQTLHGPMELFFGNSPLALIEKGKVPCLHTEKITKTKCKFLGDASGAWLESPQGNFALGGQAISRDGAPGGEYVIASVINEDLTVPCIEPSGGDTSGTSTSTELGGTCAWEEYLSTKNALGAPMQNYATREVCTNSVPHPDQAAGPTFLGCHGGENEPFYCCYTGAGAGLNDPSGRERTQNDQYFTGSAHWCHTASHGGYLVFAAKRPKTKTSPPPREVVKASPLAWRPLAPTFDIAN